MEHTDAESDADKINENQIFAIAAEVMSFFERLPSSDNYPKYYREVEGKSFFRYLSPSTTRTLHLCAESCSIQGELGWASDLRTVTRTFRDLLAALAEGVPANPRHPGLLEPLAILNGYLRRVPPSPLVYWELAEKQLAFGRFPDSASSDLAACLTNWISEYLSTYFPAISLAVCFECGKFFSRERRDNVYCSKTCQNCVAYKRKKIFETGALAPVIVPQGHALELKPGLWIHHPRLGVGLIEGVENDGLKVASILRIPTSGTQNRNSRYDSFIEQTVRVKTRFLHGVRILGYADLFEAQKKGDQQPTFHEVQKAGILAELL
jgi:hypothetical protein